MAYKIENAYKDAHIMDLNLMGIHEYKRNRFRFSEVFITVAPLIIFGVIIAAQAMPEFSFFAQCVNVPGGDTCHISMR